MPRITDPQRITVPAGQVRPGDILPSGMVVDRVSHGPLDKQIRLTNEAETETAFYSESEPVTVRRGGRS